jgi:hypothetical protein
MQVANTLVYYNTAIITAVKSFKALAPGVNFINLFTRWFFVQRTKKLKSHFTKHFCTKFGEVIVEKNCVTCEAAICW